MHKYIILIGIKNGIFFQFINCNSGTESFLVKSYKMLIRFFVLKMQLFRVKLDKLDFDGTSGYLYFVKENRILK